MKPTSPGAPPHTGGGSDMQPAVYVDSSGWIAYLSRRDGHHLEARSAFRAIVRRRIPLLTTNLVLAEVHRLLLFRAGIEPAIAALQRVGSLGQLEIEFASASHHASALEWMRRFTDQPFRYADAVSFAVMCARNCRRFIGFDRHFAVAGYERFEC